MKYLPCLATFLIMLASRGALGGAPEDVGQTLDVFHQAAARADLDTYLGVTTEDVVFLGTDGSERWQGQAFRDFVESNFGAGRGWVYTPVERRVQLGPDSEIAWFDETLHNEGLGQCRGSGVLVKSAGSWKITQYNLSVPVPNAMVQQVVADIAAMESFTEEVPGEAGTSSAMAGTAPAPQQVDEPETPERADCGRKRFKTNRKGGC